MSYEIIYNSVFLKSSAGITPCILSGSNNCYDADNRRRSRDWSVFFNELADTPENIMAKALNMTGGTYQEHWKSNGKWVDDAGVLRFFRNGIQNACTLEELLDANRDQYVGSAYCTLHVWANLDHETIPSNMSQYVRTTEDLDKWIDLVKPYMEEQRHLKKHVYPIITFSCETLHKPRAKRELTGNVVLKRKGTYLFKIDCHGSTWIHDIKQAIVMTAEEARALQKTGDSWIKSATLVSAPTAPYNAIIKATRPGDSALYVQKFTSRRVYKCYTSKGAKHYPNLAAAKRTVEKMQPRYQDKVIFEAIIDPEMVGAELTT